MATGTEAAAVVLESRLSWPPPGEILNRSQIWVMGGQAKSRVGWHSEWAAAVDCHDHVRAKSSEHQAAHCCVNESLARGAQALVVSVEPPVMTQPRERPLHE